MAQIELYYSSRSIQKHEKMSTLEFMHKYLTEKHEDYQFKSDFIEDQARDYQIRKEWNTKLIKKIINSNDQRAFERMMYKAIPDQLLKKLKAKIEKEGKEVLPEFGFRETQLKKYE